MKRARGPGLFLALLLGGCSLVGVTYENGEWLLLERVNHYLDLDWTAKTTVLVRLRGRMDAHRASELPRYVSALAHARGLAADGLSGDEIDWIADTAFALYRQTIGDTTPLAAEILAETTAAQHRHLAGALAADNRTYRETYLGAPLAERIRNRGARVIEEIQRWTGPLREHQVRLVWDYNARIPDSSEAWLEYQVARQAELLRLLETGADTAQLRALLTRWWVRLDDRPPPLQARIEQSVRDWKRLALELDRTLSANQRARLLARLDGLIEELQALLATTGA